ncbi:MAG: hypothetical protein CM15mP98_09450 [Paracoccaceae bacterium]|nr:MAG: hypothetical protein CM15mP98_09450 [Paracoccaceae bacterium]
MEKYIPGRELTVAVLNGRPLTVTDIVTDDWYNYDASIKVVVQSILFLQIFHRRYSIYALTYAVKAHHSLGCRGVTRSDFRWNERMGKKAYIFLN